MRVRHLVSALAIVWTCPLLAPPGGGAIEAPRPGGTLRVETYVDPAGRDLPAPRELWREGRFAPGEDVWVGVEVPAGIGGPARIYIVEPVAPEPNQARAHRIDQAHGIPLQDVSGGYEEVTLQPGEALVNLVRAWRSPSARGRYQVVVDRGPFGVFTPDVDVVGEIFRFEIGGVEYILIDPVLGCVRISGGGLAEWKEEFHAMGWDDGANSIREYGHGDDVPHGEVRVAWSTNVPPAKGTIDPVTGMFESGGDTGEGNVYALWRGYLSAQAVIQIMPPDWVRTTLAMGQAPPSDEMESSHPALGQLAGAAPSAPIIPLLSVHPNPARGQISLRIGPLAGEGVPALQGAGESTPAVRLTLYDLRGRAVRRLLGPGSAGPRTVIWDGRDERGERVGPGVYFARLEAGRRAATVKVILAP